TLASLAKKFTVQIVETTEQPPCIKHALEILSKGENLPHSGRFMLATYLLNKGQAIEEIAPLFKNAPDYNEKITLYQLKHLAGNFGSGTKYACPSCEKLKSENLCFAIPECANIINPLQFGRKKISNA
ncbi:MAG: DNA primase, partial [Nitrosopumilaceae archaeon]|nr:DNA primase [Nitrosopumilaceae archaeon]